MTHFRVVRQEYTAGQAARNAADDVDDANEQPAKQLLHVPHDKHLETDRYQQRKKPGNRPETTNRVS